MPLRLVRAASFTSALQAELARAVLQMHGVPACVGNAHFLTWFWHYSNACGGVRVFAWNDQLVEARAILAGKGPSSDFAVPAEDSQSAGEERPEPESPAPDEPGEWRRRPVGELARRAWQAAVLGAVMFPPLGLYSAYLVVRLVATKTPMDERSQWRYLGPVLFTLVSFAPGFLIALWLLRAFIDVSPLYSAHYAQMPIDLWETLFGCPPRPGRFHW